jgi:hypothetical protein
MEHNITLIAAEKIYKWGEVEAAAAELSMIFTAGWLVL